VTPDALRFLLSAERLYVDCWTRAFLAEQVNPAGLHRICNVGIGQGGFDDWLGLWVPQESEVVSIDIDGDVCDRFRAHQQHVGHPHPSNVVHADLLRAELGPFDLVTVTGSTLHETHVPLRALDAARAWVVSGGWLFVVILHTMGDPDRLLQGLPGVVARRTFDRLDRAEFTVALARR